ncbi:hypothetical protein GCM10010383_68230 [Streptomyces lomondensis]|uniref:Transposase n=1 Tax=Streptomyces lomondensis TaxID=68229 RepID=A0ABQ2XR23_9ACTN|nr:hypothetical protein GCM10010383_68230 [Streptomyces lomondensis]
MRRRYCRLAEGRSTGLTPHSAAKDASLPRHSGLSPIVISKVTAVSGPMNRSGSDGGSIPREDRVMARPSPYPPELRERAVRMVAEAASALFAAELDRPSKRS